jgi:hypothetical protein
MKATGGLNFSELGEACPCRYELHRADGVVEATKEFGTKLDGLYYMAQVYERIAKAGKAGEFSIRHLYFTGSFGGERLIGKIVPIVNERSSASKESEEDCDGDL